MCQSGWIAPSTSGLIAAGDSSQSRPADSTSTGSIRPIGVSAQRPEPNELGPPTMQSPPPRRPIHSSIQPMYLSLKTSRGTLLRMIAS